MAVKWVSCWLTEKVPFPLMWSQCLTSLLVSYNKWCTISLFTLLGTNILTACYSLKSDKTVVKQLNHTYYDCRSGGECLFIRNILSLNSSQYLSFPGLINWYKAEAKTQLTAMSRTSSHDAPFCFEVKKENTFPKLSLTEGPNNTFYWIYFKQLKCTAQLK